MFMNAGSPLAATSSSADCFTEYDALVQAARALHAEIAHQVRATEDPELRRSLLAQAEEVLDLVTTVSQDRLEDIRDARFDVALQLEIMLPAQTAS